MDHRFIGVVTPGLCYVVPILLAHSSHPPGAESLNDSESLADSFGTQARSPVPVYYGWLYPP